MENSIFDYELDGIEELINYHEIIFHPTYSIYGNPNIIELKNTEKHLVLILDANILSDYLRLIKTGTIPDKERLKIIAALLIWSHFYNINLTSGIAFKEFTSDNNTINKVSNENNLFLKSINHYKPRIWIEVAKGEVSEIPPLSNDENLEKYFFGGKNDHYRMHFAEVLYIKYLLHRNDLNTEQKILSFIQWNSENSLLCKYSLAYVFLLFTQKIKQAKLFKAKSWDEIERVVKNQAWDLTYLSLWSTFYTEEDSSDSIYLFTTFDVDLKLIFCATHNKNTDIFTSCLSSKISDKIKFVYKQMILNREKPVITDQYIDNLIILERKRLYDFLN